MPEVISAAAKGDIVLLLAVGVVTLSGIVGYLFKKLVDELTHRANRAEVLVDGMRESYDTLAAATDKAADVAQAALEELRRIKP